MSDPAAALPSSAKPRAKSETFDFLLFLVKLALFVIVVRSFVAAPFNIPSESMMPRLLVGDYLLVTKWNYGYSKHSLPFSVPLIPRVLAGTPKRGDIVVFKAPPTDRLDYIKRVVGLPGDRVQMIGGVLHLNGRAVPKQRVADLVQPVTLAMIAEAAARGSDSPCLVADGEEAAPEGGRQCRYARYRETLPDGRSYDVLDTSLRSGGDDTRIFTVPAGHVFLMGDNRDHSSDSRVPAVDEGGGVGFVPQGNLIGKAAVTVFSTDGNAAWLMPWTWFTAARWERIGETF